jgi:hypothetical protein
MLSVTNKPFMLSITNKHFMLSVTNKPFILSVIGLNVVMLNVIMMSVAAPIIESFKTKFGSPFFNKEKEKKSGNKQWRVYVGEAPHHIIFVSNLE